MLTVIINAIAKPYLTRMEIVQPRGIVIAEQECRLVIRILFMNGCTHNIQTMYLPCQTGFESFTATKNILCRYIIILSMSVCLIIFHKFEQHTVTQTIVFECINGFLQGIIRQPVVTVNHTYKVSVGNFKTDVARMCLTTVFR